VKYFIFLLDPINKNKQNLNNSLKSFKNSRVKTIGTLKYIEGMVYCEKHDKYDANVLKKYPMGKNVVALLKHI